MSIISYVYRDWVPEWIEEWIGHGVFFANHPILRCILLKRCRITMQD